jgi:hypothetical protein
VGNRKNVGNRMITVPGHNNTHQMSHSSNRLNTNYDSFDGNTRVPPAGNKLNTNDDELDLDNMDNIDDELDLDNMDDELDLDNIFNRNRPAHPAVAHPLDIASARARTHFDAGSRHSSKDYYEDPKEFMRNRQNVMDISTIRHYPKRGGLREYNPNSHSNNYISSVPHSPWSLSGARTELIDAGKRRYVANNGQPKMDRSQYRQNIDRQLLTLRQRRKLDIPTINQDSEMIF